MTEYFEQTDHGKCVGAIKQMPPEGGIAVEAKLEKEFIPETDAWLSDISVLKEYRGKTGEGKKLIGDFEMRCRKAHCRRIIGSFEPSNDVDFHYMITWYEKNQYYFKQSQRDPNIYYVIKDLV